MGDFLRPEDTADLMAFGQNLAKTQVGTTTSRGDCSQQATMQKMVDVSRTVLLWSAGGLSQGAGQGHARGLPEQQ